MLYVAPIMLLLGFTDETYTYYCFEGILLARNSRHLWYILVLFEIYVVCAFFKTKMQSRNKKLQYMIITIFLIMSYLSVYLPNIWGLRELAYYLFFFYLGYLYNRYFGLVISVAKKPITIIMTILLFIITSYFNNWPFRVMKAILGTIIIISGTTYIPQNFTKSSVISEINRNSFGIYLFHPMIIYIMYYFLGSKNINPFILSSIITIISYLISIGATIVFRKINLSFLLGE